MNYKTLSHKIRPGIEPVVKLLRIGKVILEVTCSAKGGIGIAINAT